MFSAVFSAVLAAAALAWSGFLAGCMGGSDGIENPKVELEFQGPDGTSQGSGEVRVYARFMNPVEDDKPLLTKTFSGKAACTLQVEDLDAALKAELGAGTLPDTVVDFNVVAVSGDREAFVAGFRYKREGTKAGFAQGSWNRNDLVYGDVKKKVDLLAAVLDFKGAMGANGVSYGIDYVYIPGSPYHAEVTQVDASAKRGEFHIARMSSGSYDLFGADRDSATFYKSGDSLNTKDTAYTAKTWDVVTIIDK